MMTLPVTIEDKREFCRSQEPAVLLRLHADETKRARESGDAVMQMEAIRTRFEQVSQILALGQQVYQHELAELDRANQALMKRFAITDRWLRDCAYDEGQIPAKAALPGIETEPRYAICREFDRPKLRCGDGTILAIENPDGAELSYGFEQVRNTVRKNRTRDEGLLPGLRLAWHWLAHTHARPYAHAVDLALLNDRLEEWLLACAAFWGRLRLELEKVKLLTEWALYCHHAMRSAAIICDEDGLHHRGGVKMQHLHRMALGKHTGRRLLAAQGVPAACWA